MRQYTKHTGRGRDRGEVRVVSRSETMERRGGGRTSEVLSM
jgi:hypothetical protein